MLKYLGFGNGEITLKESDIIKEGFLNKESRIRKIWRQRWTVLTDQYLLTFEKEGVYENPTEIIQVSSLKSVKSDDNPLSFNFRVETTEGNFIFEANSLDDKESWIGHIGKCMVQVGTKNVFIKNMC